jgi:glycosyltransferase involved in cell wall biosynthesis
LRRSSLGPGTRGWSPSRSGPVRIGIDLTALLPQRTGVDNYLTSLVSHLARIDRRNRYRLFVNREDRERFDDLPSGFAIVTASLRPRLVRLLFQQGFLPLATRDLDVLHSPAFLMPVVRGRLRHLLTVHDMTFFSMPEHHTPLRRSVAFRRAVLTSIRRADRITVPTLSVKGEILERIPDLPSERVETIGYGISKDFRPHRADELQPVLSHLGLPRRYLLHVGTIEPRKNLDCLLEAFAEVVRLGRVHEDLVLAGKLGWGYQPLIERLDSLQLRRRVHLLGYVADADLPALYAGASLFVYPSWAEGFGFPPLEAMASGTPVIASRTDVLSENLDGAAALVPPEDPASLAAEIDRLLRDEPRQRMLRERGFERAKGFSWGRAARRTLAIYEDLAERGGRSAEAG